MAAKPTKISQRKKLELTSNIKNYETKLGMLKDDSVVYREVDFSDKFDTAVLVFISDWHLGARHFNMDGVVNTLEYVLNTPNALLFALGDSLSSAILNAVSNMFEDALYPQEQWDLIIDLLTQVAQQGKLVIYHDGNHERRIYKQTSLAIGKQTVTALASNQKNAKDKKWAKEAYAPHFGVSKVILKNKDSSDGKFTFNTTTHHGDDVDFVKMKNLNPSADLNVVGHWHRLEIREDTRIVYETETHEQFFEKTININLPNEGKTPFEYSHLEKDRSPYFAVEISFTKNPLYDKNSKAQIKHKEFIPTLRSIPILTTASTREKDKVINEAKKIIDKTQSEHLRVFLSKITEAVAVLECAGVEFSKEILLALNKLYSVKEKPTNTKTSKNNKNNKNNNQNNQQ